MKLDYLEESRSRLLNSLRYELGDVDVIKAMERIPRETFVPEESIDLAYENVALPIGQDQTISQPYIIVLMVTALGLHRTHRVLEVGTGSGYQAAILSQLAQEVITVERIRMLAKTASCRLRSLGYHNVETYLTENQLGWPLRAPYDAIIVSCGAPMIPSQLVDQLVEGGKLVVPVGSRNSQELLKITRNANNFSVTSLTSCRFVPLIGQGAWSDNS